VDSHSNNNRSARACIHLMNSTFASRLFEEKRKNELKLLIEKAAIINDRGLHQFRQMRITYA
jgi:hypothetical protein